MHLKSSFVVLCFVLMIFVSRPSILYSQSKLHIPFSESLPADPFGCRIFKQYS